jgi:hypothetical protein
MWALQSYCYELFMILYILLSGCDMYLVSLYPY